VAKGHRRAPLGVLSFALSLCFPRHQLNKKLLPFSVHFLLGGDAARTLRHPITKNAAEIGFGQG
jgi:hypothetical protein